MGSKTKVEYVDHTWSAWRGCEHKHTGCENCFAQLSSVRNPRVLGTWGGAGIGTRVLAADAYWRKPKLWNEEAKKEGRRHRVLWDLSDPFEGWAGWITSHGSGVMTRPYLESENLRENWIESNIEDMETDPQGWQQVMMQDVLREAFEVIDETPWLDWILATKRPENIRRMIIELGPTGEYVKHGPAFYRKNVWLLYSASDQESLANGILEIQRCADLVPVWGLSLEPLIGPVNLRWMRTASECMLPKWIVIGGESGAKASARPCDPAWIDSLLYECDNAGVAVYVQQLGRNPVGLLLEHSKGGMLDEWPTTLQVREYPV